MRALLQRVSSAQVSIDGKQTGSVAGGLVILLGVGDADTKAQADVLWNKILNLRIFEDENGKTNLSLADVGGELLVVSQFTLYADCKKGRRPSFTQAKAPNEANELYEYFIALAQKDVSHVATGEFGAMMDISLVNNGPFTIWLDTDRL